MILRAIVFTSLLASLASAAGPDELLNRWSLEATAFDCPMTPTEARDLQKLTGGAFDVFAADIGCACAVKVEAGVMSRPSCRVGESVTLFQRENMVAQKEQLQAEARAQMAAGKKGSVSVKPKVSAEAQRLIDWVGRLKAKAELPVDQLTRKVPLDAGKDAPVLVGKEEEFTKSFQALKQTHARLVSEVEGLLWDIGDATLRSLRTELAFHERVTLNGKQSAAGRALLADGETLMKAGAQQLAAMRRRNADPQTAKIEALLGPIGEERRTFEKLWGVSVSVGCSTGKPKACELERRDVKVQELTRALDDKYGIKRKTP